VKILLVNKFYFEKGGAERYLFSLQDLLEDAGHEVVPFAMRHPKNVKTEADRFFVSRVDLERPRFSWQGIRAAGRVIYSFEAVRRLRALLAVFKPDVAHLHNIYHQLSPSVLKALHDGGVPIVQTLHDYAYLSPSYGLFDHGAVCERVKPRRYFAAVGHRCVKNSFFASILDAAAYRLHAALGLDERLVDRLIAPSEFVKRKFAEWGRDEKKIEVLPHFIDAARTEPVYVPGDNLLYVGRLSEEKGIGVLVAAMERLTEERLKIVGAGPMERRLKDYVASAKLRNVEFAGALDHPATLRAIAASRLVVVPSLSHETFGYAPLEAHALGKAVIASSVGALPEAVMHGETGLLVPPNDVDALVKAVKALSDNEPLMRRFGAAGRERVLARYRPEDHLARLEEIYRKVLY